MALQANRLHSLNKYSPSPRPSASSFLSLLASSETFSKGKEQMFQEHMDLHEF